MHRAQQGDADAYRALLEDVAPMLRQYLRRRFGDTDSVDDVLQDALISIHRARHSYDARRPFEPWLFAIARNVAVSHRRRLRTRAAWEEYPGELPSVAGSLEAYGPDLEAILAKLSEPQREAFQLVQIDGLTVEAAAERAGITPGALKLRAHRAYKALRRLLRS
jgi:RNA polymerase sigma-70 factor (ECF subfamily)